MSSQPFHAPKSGTRPATGSRNAASWTDIAFVAAGVLLVVVAVVAKRSHLRLRRSRFAA